MTNSLDSKFENSLSCGSLQKILDGQDIDSAILQILGFKKVPGEGIERFRLLLNDGIKQFSFAILSTTLNHLIVNKELEKYTVFKLNKYVCTQAQPNKKLIICLDIIPLIPGCRVNAQIDYTQNMTCTTVPNYQSFISSPDSITQIPVKTEVKYLKDEGCSIFSTNNCRNNLPQSNIKTESLGPRSSAALVPKPLFMSSIVNNSKYNSISSVGNNENNVLDTSPHSVGRNSFTSVTRKQFLSSFKFDNHNRYESQTETNNSCSLINAGESAVQSQRKICVIPISCLTPYQNKWTVKARVIYKSHVIDYTNVKKSGKIFTFYLSDSSGEIRATAFDDLAEHAYQFIQLNKVYYVSNAIVKLPKHDTPSKYEYELSISFSTKIEEFIGDCSDVPLVDFKFTPLNQVEQAMNGFVDVIGVCIDASDLKIINVKGREVQKLDFTIVDMKNSLITVSLWGIEAENFKPQYNPVIAIKNAKVTNFNKCSLSISSSSMLFINPAIREVHLLKGWFHRHSKDIQLNAVSERNQPWKKLSDVTIDAFNGSDKSDYFTVKATVIMVQKDNSLYQSCPSSNCSKKVSVTPDNLYHCSKCNKDYDSYSWTLMLHLNIADFSADLWVVAFRETAELIIKYKTEELSNLKENNADKYMEILSELHFKSFIFKLRSRVESFSNTSQLKTTVLEAKPVESLSYTKKLLFDINRFENILNKIE